MSERKNFPGRLTRNDLIWIAAIAIVGGILAILWLN